jgi:hypothetical protein
VHLGAAERGGALGVSIGARPLRAAQAGRGEQVCG